MNLLRRETPQFLSPDSLMAERPRLIRYCARFTRRSDAAEDLAQETLITAWETRDRLRDYASSQAYLTGVAKNVCLRFLRRQASERRRLTSAESAPDAFSADDLPDASLPDMNELLERQEVERLLERALTALPRSVHQLLIDRYIHELPLAEIAERRGVREETVAVHLHRGRRALHKILIAPAFVEETTALGLTEDAAARCQETSVWCPKCGQRRLRGYLGYCPTDNTGETSCGSGGGVEFFLSCPACDRDGDVFLMMRTVPGQANEHFLRGVKGIKPALNRADRWWNNLVESAVTTGTSPCFRCGQQRQINTQFPADFYEKPLANRHGLWSICERCQKPCHISVEQMNLIHATGAAFWKNNPRLLMLPAQKRPSANGLLIVSRLESVTGSGFVEFARSARTLALVETTHG